MNVSTNVRVGSYNVKNLFAERDVTPNNGARVKSEWEKGALAEVIDTVDADVVTLQEVTSKETLLEFINQYDLAEKYPHVVHSEGNDGRGVNVAYLSKYPVVSYTTHADTEFPVQDGSGDQIKFSRDLLRVDIDVNGDSTADLSLYNTHSKSRRPSRTGISSEMRRLSEATAVRNIVESEMAEYPNRLFVVTGDFNDGTPDPAVQAVLNPGEGQEKWLDSLEHLPLKERQTWPANPNRSHGFDPVQFDHIIYSSKFEENMVGSEVHRLGESRDGTYRWLSSAASDHHMITADFKVPHAD